jgi:reactive intermediate/imine deaminase
VDAGFLVNRHQMIADCARADVEACGDFAVGKSRTDHMCKIAFESRQLCQLKSCGCCQRFRIGLHQHGNLAIWSAWSQWKNKQFNRTQFHNDAALSRVTEIGLYSQAMRAGDTIYISGQLPLDLNTGALMSGSFEDHVRQVFANMSAIATAAGSSLDRAVKITVFLTDMNNFGVVNAVMAELFTAPYAARAAIGVASLPRGATVEADAIPVL